MNSLSELNTYSLDPVSFNEFRDLKLDITGNFASKDITVPSGTIEIQTSDYLNAAVSRISGSVEPVFIRMEISNVDAGDAYFWFPTPSDTDGWTVFDGSDNGWMRLYYNTSINSDHLQILNDTLDQMYFRLGSQTSDFTYTVKIEVYNGGSISDQYTQTVNVTVT